MAARNINSTFGLDLVSYPTARRWFQIFRSGRNSTKRKHGSGRSVTVDKRVLANRLQHPDASSAELARGHCSKVTAWLVMKATSVTMAQCKKLYEVR